MDFSLYVITAEVPSLGRSHADVARAALEGGATAIQFRDKYKSGEEFLAAASSVQDLCATYGIPFVVNDCVEAACALDADGLHVGQDDLGALVEWRTRDRFFCGISITEPGQTADAEALKPDYLGVGPVFPTPSKADAADPMGLQGLAEICASTQVPVVAIGGITEDRVAEVIAAGAAGVCVIGAVAYAKDPVDAARRLRSAVYDAQRREGAR